MASKDLVVRLLGDASNLNKALDGAGRDVSKVGAKLTKTLTPAALAVGGAMTVIGSNWNDARDAIVAGTGASGKALDDLLDSTKSVASGVTDDFGTVGQAIAAVNTQTGATGDTLEELTTQVLKASKALGEDGVSNAENFGKSLSQWNKPAEEGAELLDGLVKLGQDYGIGLDEQIRQLNEYGPVMQNAGFSLEETAEMQAKLHAEGIKWSRISPGLNKSFRDWAAAGKEPREELELVVDRIANAEDSVEALNIATGVFGAEGAQRMTVAIRNGAISLDDLGEAMDGAEGTVDDMHDGTLRLTDRLKMLRNRVTGVLGPFGEMGGVIAGAAASAGPLLFGLGQMAPALGKVRVAFVKLAGAMRGHPLLLAAGVIAGVTAAFIAFNNRASAAEKRVDELAEAMRNADSAADGLVNQLNGMVAESDELAAILVEAGTNTSEMADAALEGGEAWATMRERLLEGAEATGASTAELEAFEKGLADYDDIARQAAERTDLYNKATGEATESLGDASLAMDDVRRSGEDLTDATVDLTEATEDTEQAALKAAAAFDEETKALEDAAAAAKDNEDAVNDMVDAQRASVDATFAHRRSQERFRDEIDKVNKVLNDEEATLHDVRRALDDATLSAGSMADGQVDIARKTADANGEVITASQETDIWNREMIDAAATADGPLRDSIISYIAKVNDIPDHVVSEIEALLDEGKVEEAAALLEETSATRKAQIIAEADVSASEATLEHHVRPRSVTVRVNQEGTVTLPSGGTVRKHGGPVPGGKSQAVPILAHGGEYVLDAGTVDAIKQGRKSAGAASGSGAPQTGGRPAGPLVNVEHLEINSGIDVEAFAQQLNARLVVM